MKTSGTHGEHTPDAVPASSRTHTPSSAAAYSWATRSGTCTHVMPCCCACRTITACWSCSAGVRQGDSHHPGSSATTSTASSRMAVSSYSSLIAAQYCCELTAHYDVLVWLVSEGSCIPASFGVSPSSIPPAFPQYISEPSVVVRKVLGCCLTIWEAHVSHLVETCTTTSNIHNVQQTGAPHKEAKSRDRDLLPGMVIQPLECKHCTVSSIKHTDSCICPVPCTWLGNNLILPARNLHLVTFSSNYWFADSGVLGLQLYVIGFCPAGLPIPYESLKRNRGVAAMQYIEHSCVMELSPQDDITDSVQDSVRAEAATRKIPRTPVRAC
jgi:hypothetical protein